MHCRESGETSSFQARSGYNPVHGEYRRFSQQNCTEITTFGALSMAISSVPYGFGSGIVIGSGALGCNLQPYLDMAGDPVELLNLRNPGVVRDLHAAYLDAGSQLIVTNTFGANPIVLQELGVGETCEKMNRAGVEIARDASGGDIPVWGSVGPMNLGLGIEDYTTRDLVTQYRLQCNAFREADALLLETFSSVREAEAALAAAGETGLPVVLQIGNIGSGPAVRKRIEKFVEAALRAHVIAIGANCQHPNRIVDTVAYLSGRVDLPITASANAGHPSITRGVVEYEFPPSQLVETGRRLIRQGVSLIGGCCGTTPAHIKALSDALAGEPVVVQERVVPVVVLTSAPHIEVARPKNPVRALVDSERFIISVEVRPNRKQSLESIIADTAAIVEAGADLLDVPENPGATVGRDPMVVAAALQNFFSVPAIQHKTVTQSNLLQLHSSLIGGWDLGLRGILALTGDAPNMGHLGSSANRVKDLKSSVELLRLIERMREGEMSNGEAIADPPDYCSGCSVSSLGSVGQVRWLEKKADAGACFTFSQPFFNIDDFRALRDKIGHINLRFFPGIMPLISQRNAAFMAAGHIPGINVHESMVEQFANYTDAADQQKFGMESALELAQAIAEESDALYVIMPFGKDCYRETASLIGNIRSTQGIHVSEENWGLGINN